MADIPNSKNNERSNVERPNFQESLQWKMKIEKMKGQNSLISKGKYENWQNCEWCEILDGRTISKFANFLNFDCFPNWKNYENLLIYQFGKFKKI